jgi:hypothetical protein
LAVEAVDMKVLHILKSEPDETVLTLMAGYDGHDVRTIAVYEDDVDWGALVDDVFSHDHVICWW